MILVGDSSHINSFYTQLLIYANCSIAPLTVGKLWTLHLLRDKPELIVLIGKQFPGEPRIFWFGDRIVNT